MFSIYSQVKFNLDAYFLNAVKNNNVTQTEEAIRAGANIKIKDFRGNSALHIAVLNNNINMVELLIRHDIAKDSVNSHGQTALMLALSKGNIDIIKIFGADENPYKSEDYDFNNDLHFAVRGNNIDVVKYIINNKNVKKSNINGTTALLSGCKIKNIDTSIIELLIKYGAKIEHRDKYGRFPLLEACSTGNLDVVKILLKNGAIINKKAIDGSSPILEASASKNYDLVLFLIEHGANVNMENNLGVTPLIVAAGLSYEISELLVKNGAKIKLRADFNSPYSVTGGDALYTAASKNRGDIVKLLIENGANVNTQNYLGFTPLLEALRYNNEELFYYIKERGGNIYAKDGYGRNGLFYTVDNKNYELTKVLLENGVRPGYDYIAETPYTIAYKNEYGDIAQLLLFYDMSH